MTAKPKKRRTKADSREEELEEQVREYAVIKDRMDALDEMLKQRKQRILLLMSETGLSRFDGGAGTAAFTRRRSFKVYDAERLVGLMTPRQLAENVRITADVYDACEAEDIPINEAVKVGRSENLTVSRSRTKAAKERRKQYIEESRRQAEQRINSIRAQLRGA